MRVTSLLEKSALFVLALGVNLGLYLLVPYIQILILKHSGGGPKSPHVVTTVLVMAPPQTEKIIKHEIKEIKTQSLNPPQPNPSRPSTPGGGLKIDLSPAGGEGLALVSGGDRTGGIGSGTGGGVGQGISAQTYEQGQTDVDAKALNNPPLKFPPRAQREEVTGVVELTFVVNERGNVEQISILKEEPVGYGFASKAMESAGQLRFKPASVQKTPVRQRFKQTFRFGVEGK